MSDFRAGQPTLDYQMRLVHRTAAAFVVSKNLMNESKKNMFAFYDRRGFMCVLNHFFFRLVELSLILSIMWFFNPSKQFFFRFNKTDCFD